MNDKDSTLFRDTIILTIGNICSKVVAFGSVFFFTRWISVSAFGVFDLITTYNALLIPIFSLAIYEAVYRYLVDCVKQSDISKVISNSLVFTFLGSIVMTIFTLYSGFLDSVGINKICLLLYLLSSLFFTLLQYIIRGFKHLVDFAICGVLFSITMFLMVTFFIYFNDMGLQGMILGNFIAYIVCDIYLACRIRISNFINYKHIDMLIIKKLLFYSIPLLFTGISWWIMNISNRTIINYCLGSYDNGIFAVANKIPSIIAILYSSFQYSWIQSAIEQYNNANSIIWFNKIFNKIITFLMCSSIMILSLNDFIFRYLFVDAYSIARFHMPLLTMGVVCLEVGTFFGAIYIAKKQTLYQSVTFIIPAAFNIFFCFCLIKYIGLYAASISTLCANALLMILRYYDTRKEFSWKIDRTNMILIGIMSLFFGVSMIISNDVSCLGIAVALVIDLYVYKDTIYLLACKMRQIF